MDPRKVAAITEWAPPTCCTDVRRFVGLANYCRKFVLRFSRNGTSIAAPLTALVASVKASLRWGPAAAEQSSFDEGSPSLSTGSPGVGPSPTDSSCHRRFGACSVGSPRAAGRLGRRRAQSRRLRVAEALRRRARVPGTPAGAVFTVVNALLAFRPYVLLDRLFDLHTDNASLQWSPRS
jgi:hypothetical protein